MYDLRIDKERIWSPSIAYEIMRGETSIFLLSLEVDYIAVLDILAIGVVLFNMTCKQRKDEVSGWSYRIQLEQ